MSPEEVEALHPVWKLLCEREQRAVMRANNSAAKYKEHEEAKAELARISIEKATLQVMTDQGLS